MHKVLLKLGIVLICLFSSTIIYANSSLFPVEGNIRERVEFWKKVYTQISSQEAFLHDPDNLNIIYKKIRLPNGRRARKRLLKKEKRNIKNILRKIAKGKTSNLSSEGQKILGIVLDKSSKDLYRMARNIRAQYGLRDRYYKGLIRSYKYLDFIQKTYQDMGLPLELSYLPHVESSFNYKAYSKVGAAGIWQFMRSTGRLYGLKVNYIVDERRDPIKATKAAARLLRDNYRKLNSWPLALSAYNHGARSMVRAIKKLGTTNINTIVQKYKGRRFGFASKNFYSTFMATVEISRNPEKYFKTFKRPKKFAYSTLHLAKSYTVDQVVKALGISKETIREYNYEVRPIAFRSPLYLPRNFTLKLPITTSEMLASYNQKLKEIKIIADSDKTEHLHVVSRRETLFDISQIYKVDMYKIIAFNNISNPSRIFPGMKLKIPGKKSVVETKKIKPKKKVVKVATLKQGERKGKDIYKFDGDLFTKTFGKVFKKEKERTSDTPTPLILPQINLNAYELDIQKIKPNLYRIVIDTEETLGHYADWGLVRIARIKKANRLRSHRNIILGQNLLLPILDKKLNRFKEQRNEYHLSIQEDFFEKYSISGSKTYRVKKGDNLNDILQEHSLPFWLVRQHQKDGKLPTDLKIGQKIELPILSANDEEDVAVLPTESTED